MKKAKRNVRKRRPRPAFVRLMDYQRSNRLFMDALDRAITFHRNNRNDHHNVGNAVIAALSEVRDAFGAYIC